MDKCQLCPRECGVDRSNGERGFCGLDSNLRVARAGLHEWEEPCISGARGSGTVFFTGCSLRCVFCQNCEISQGGVGNIVSEERLAEIFLELQSQGAHNINLVTPTHYTPQILSALKMAKARGLKIPVVWNSSGYEKVETLKTLAEHVDIYLPDLKYIDAARSERYSHAADYFAHAGEALKEMFYQVGEAEFDDAGIMRKGMIIRHLLLPGGLEDGKSVVDFVLGYFGPSVYLSLMHQYTPLHRSSEYPEIAQPTPDAEYAALLQYAQERGLLHGFWQEGAACSRAFVPAFDGTGVER